MPLYCAPASLGAAAFWAGLAGPFFLVWPCAIGAAHKPTSSNTAANLILPDKQKVFMEIPLTELEVEAICIPLQTDGRLLCAALYSSRCVFRNAMQSSIGEQLADSQLFSATC